MKPTARPQTGSNIERPMTTKAAGYSKSLGKDTKDFGTKTKMFFHKKPATTKEQIIRELEKNLQKLLCFLINIYKNVNPFKCINHIHLNCQKQ